MNRKRAERGGGCLSQFLFRIWYLCWNLTINLGGTLICRGRRRCPNYLAQLFARLSCQLPAELEVFARAPDRALHYSKSRMLPPVNSDDWLCQI